MAVSQSSAAIGRRGRVLAPLQRAVRILRPLQPRRAPLTSLSASSQLSASTLLQQLLASSQTAPVQGAGQDPPTSGPVPAATADAPPSPPPPKPDDSGSSRLSSDTLASLLQFQNQPASGASTSTSSPFSGLASQLISANDSDGSGGLSLSEIETSLGVGTARSTSPTSASTDAQSQVAQVFSQLDADGDGSLSQNELTSALQQNASQGTAGAHHGRHHHHGGGGGVQAAATQTSTSTSATSAASDASDSTPSPGAQALAA